MPISLQQWEAEEAKFPSTNAPAALFRPGTNYPSLALAFALNEKAYFKGVVPDSYSGGDINFLVYWEGGAGASGSATWGIKYIGREDDRIFDAALSSQATIVDALTVVGDLQVATASIASPALVSGDVIIFEVQLVSALTGGDALLHGVQLLEQ